MQDLVDPTTEKIADDKTKNHLLEQYLKIKFEKEANQETWTYPREMIPTSMTINHLILHADLRKTTGFDYIPYQALTQNQFKITMERDLSKMLTENGETEPFFNAKLVIFNKNKSGKPPTVDQIRLIACTNIV